MNRLNKEEIYQDLLDQAQEIGIENFVKYMYDSLDVKTLFNLYDTIYEKQKPVVSKYRKYKGVYLTNKKYKDKVYTYWACHIKVSVAKYKQKTVSLGIHDTPEKAAQAYNEAIDEYRISKVKKNIIGTYEEIRKELDHLKKKNEGEYWSDRDLIRYKELKEIDNEN